MQKLGWDGGKDSEIARYPWIDHHDVSFPQEAKPRIFWSKILASVALLHWIHNQQERLPCSITNRTKQDFFWPLTVGLTFLQWAIWFQSALGFPRWNSGRLEMVSYLLNFVCAASSLIPLRLVFCLVLFEWPSAPVPGLHTKVERVWQSFGLSVCWDPGVRFHRWCGPVSDFPGTEIPQLSNTITIFPATVFDHSTWRDLLP